MYFILTPPVECCLLAAWSATIQPPPYGSSLRRRPVSGFKGPGSSRRQYRFSGSVHDSASACFSSGPADRPEIRGLYVCWLLVKSVVEAGCRFDKPGTVSVSQTGRVVVWKFWTRRGGWGKVGGGAGPINSAKFPRCSALQLLCTFWLSDLRNLFVRKMHLH